MSDPEIARRCTACGAAVRGRAKFCPQCGLNMSEAPTLIHDSVAPSPPADSPLSLGGGGDGNPAHELKASLLEASGPPGREPAGSRDSSMGLPLPPPPAAVEHPRGRARGGLPEASSGVWDDALEDPGGGRFVVLAGALFVLFLLLLIFSHVIR